MTEEELAAYERRAQKQDHGREGTLRAELEQCDGPHDTIWATEGHELLALLDGARQDALALVAEVRTLNGLLADLCDDSRAAAEAVRLREALREIAEPKPSGPWMAPKDVMDYFRAVARDALEHRP